MSELKLENVGYRYKNGDRDVLQAVSCIFEPGNLCAVVGPSGSGKTTLLSLMAGLDRPGEGKLFIDGEDLAAMDLDRYRRERVAMIFQAFQLFPLQTALENVCYPMELNGVPLAQAKERAKELLAAVDIAEEKHRRYPSNLSGGEQQRIAIARALSTGAKLLLADEPTGNLDTANGNRVIDIFRHLARNENYCIIVVTHDLAIADACDQVYRITDGVLTAKSA